MSFANFRVFWHHLEQHRTSKWKALLCLVPVAFKGCFEGPSQVCRSRIVCYTVVDFGVWAPSWKHGATCEKNDFAWCNVPLKVALGTFSSLLGPCGHLKLIICMFGNVFSSILAHFWDPLGTWSSSRGGLLYPGMLLYRCWVAFGTLRGRKSRDFHNTVVDFRMLAPFWNTPKKHTKIVTLAAASCP